MKERLIRTACDIPAAFLFAEDGEAKKVDDSQKQISEAEFACGKTIEPD
ncbi:hypothetical protein [Cohnella cellulosilytica]|uniref:Uncharacterized protein n=1 Tax=Cohnella cellulosilytica TaxID=986710 RepID=A0ABW2FHK8_9BACL